jgi:Flp pilus assembly protein TadB
MQTSVLSSTFFLTLLLAVGLFFFIKASVKDRIQQMQLTCEQSQDMLWEQLKSYFQQRAYYAIAEDATQKQITFEGHVRPSWFLAIFLSALAAVGLLCLALVLALLFPEPAANFVYALVLLAPLAGVFYWRGANRTEQVKIQVQPHSESHTNHQSMVTAIGHRDELATLKQTLQKQGNLTPANG